MEELREEQWTEDKWVREIAHSHDKMLVASTLKLWLISGTLLLLALWLIWSYAEWEFIPLY